MARKKRTFGKMMLFVSIIAMSLCGIVSVIAADTPDDGRTMSFNSKMTVVPAPGKVVIDGKTDDWDLSAGVWCYNDPIVARKMSVWVHLMYDDKGVYFLARYNDKSPMQNQTKGKDFDKSWRADCYQGRVIFDDRTPDEHQMHINMFYSTPEAKPYMLVKHGGFKANPPFDDTGKDRPDQAEKYGNTMDKEGGSIAFRTWDDGKGYNVEAFWPWTYCRTNAQPLKPGESFTFGIESMWGNADGTGMIHRLADGIKDEKVNRIFMFRARSGWGKAVISDKGKLGITADQIALHAQRLKQFEDYSTTGVVPIKYDLAENRDVTIAIDNADGLRVRNLFGQFPREKGAITDYWDGMDDNGKPVAPGKYTAVIVDHKPVSLKISNSLYNAATPPWATEKGTKLWGSNHGNPTSVATQGDITMIGFTGTEGGSGLIRITPDGYIIWSDKNEIYDVTIGDQYAYTISAEAYFGHVIVRRLRLLDGQIIPFTDENKSPNITLLKGSSTDISIPINSSIANFAGKVFVLMPGKTMYRLEPEVGTIEANLDAGSLVAIKTRNGKMYGLQSDGKVVILSVDGQAISTVCEIKGLVKPMRIGISMDEKQIAISERATNQVLVFNATGKKQKAIGNSYPDKDRPAGKFIETDFTKPLGVDIDQTGRLWVAEGSASSRRITCWTTKGKLLKSFWGGADYGAMSAFAIPGDSTRFIVHGIEFQMDPKANPLVRPTQEKPLYWHPALYPGRGFIYNYQGYDYAVTLPGYNGGSGSQFIIAKRDKKSKVFKIVVRVTYPGSKREGNRNVESPGKGWSDLNENGVEDPGEVTVGFKGRVHYWSAGWCRPDMTFITNDYLIYRLKGLSKTGVPIYDFANPEIPKNQIPSDLAAQGSTGTVAMDMKGNISNGIAFNTVDGHKGKYPNPYGRHDAPAAQRGLLIAPFRTNGVVEDVPNVGSITALAGDRGEWFLMTMDGIFLSAICQDSKGDVTLDETFIGQESFGGFIWRDSKGKLLVQLGGPSYRIMEVQGLESCQKRVITFDLTDAQIQEGVKMVAERRKKMGLEPEELTVAKVTTLPTKPVDPDMPQNEPMIAGVSDFTVRELGNNSQWWRGALMHDGANMAVLFQVNDNSPWKNGEARYTHEFIGGDCVDLKLTVPGRGDIRLLTAPMAGKDTAIYWQKKAPAKENPFTYMVGNNASNAQAFDVVRLAPNVKVQSARGINGYSVLVTIPLTELGIDLNTMPSLQGIVGVIFSDPSGTNRAMRLYWHDKSTGLVSDVPSEAKIETARFGTIKFGK